MRQLLRLLLLIPLLAACSLIPEWGSSPSGPTPIPVPSPTPMPAAQVIFHLVPPQGTARDAEITLFILDEVTGLPYNTSSVEMQRLSDGRYQAQLISPVGSLVHYRYTRTDPGPADETTSRGEVVSYRVAYVTGPMQVDDIAAGWIDAPYAGPTGRVVGHLRDAVSGRSLAEMLVNVAGLTTFTDGEGFFRIDGLLPGLHSLIAVTPDGSHRPHQQGAVIAAESATIAEIALQPAPPVQVAFQVTVPSDTPPGGPLRLAGNLSIFGNRFTVLPGGLSTSAARMPVLTRVDNSNYLLVATLYAGTDLRYKYTLGDGLWNAERSPQGAFLTRQLIVPEQELVVEDTVSVWRAGNHAAITFSATVPADTPPTDTVSIQFNPFGWFEPLPMTQSGANAWIFVLHGPLDFRGSLGYRYCRNLACGSADDVDTAGPAAVGRQVTPSSAAQDVRDTVHAWQWWGAELTPTTVVAPEIAPRAGFEAGVEFVADYRPSWAANEAQAIADIANGGANALTLTPTWILRQSSPMPVVGFDPAYAPFRWELESTIAAARRLGLEVALRPTLRPPEGNVQAWWATAPHDSAWWDVWFEAYRSLAVTYAQVAAESGATTLILGGPEAAPSLPGGLLANGSPSGAPLDSESRWRALLADVRAFFDGRLAFEIELGEDLQDPPAFLDGVDEVRVYWHAPLGEGSDLSSEEMQTAAGRRLDALLANPELAGKPIVLSVEYLSLDGSATACAPAPDGSCRPPSDFDSGAVVDADLPANLIEQAQAINAVLAAAYSREGITGFTTRGYNPAAALQDKSASVNGKPARDVLWYWYPRLTGRQS